MAKGVPGGLGSQIFMTFGTRRWRGRQAHAPAAFTPGMFLVLSSTRGRVDPMAVVRSEGNMSLKNPVTPPGIDLGTVRLVAQRLNHYATPSPCLRGERGCKLPGPGCPEGGPGPKYLAYTRIFIFLGSIVISRLYKLTLSDLARPLCNSQSFDLV